jgi:hypothetical protein
VSYRTAIQNVLVETADAGSFPTAIYSNARPSLLTEGPSADAASIEANEARASFEIDERFGRTLRQERTSWAWVLRLRFEQEVSLETFEQALLETPITIQRDASDGRPRQVRLLLDDASYDHPPRGGPSNGTKVEYRFVADLCPQ